MQEEFKKRYYCSEPHSQNRLCEALLLLMMALNSNKKGSSLSETAFHYTFM